MAALARFLSGHVRRQDGPEHGMAYDVQRFNELTKQMSAYAHYQRGQEHLELAAKRAARRALASSPSSSTSGCASASAITGRQCGCSTARQLLDSEHPAHQAAGRTLYASAQRELRLEQRDERLLAGRHPGDADGRYRAAYRYAQRWGLPRPPAGGRGRRGEASVPVSSVCWRSARRDAMPARRPDCQPRPWGSHKVRPAWRRASRRSVGVVASTGDRG